MDQQRIGSFLKELRKEQNLTQEQLAEALGVSGRTVSRWETGHGMPDVSLLQPLCEKLSVNLNELLSGERLSDECYNGKAEENMMNLAKDVQKERSNRKRVGIIGLICGVLFFLLFIEFAIVSTTGWGGAAGFIDYPTMVILVGILIGIELIAGKVKRVFNAIVAAIKKDTLSDDKTKNEYIKDMNFAIKSTIIATLFSAMIGFINFLNTFTDVYGIGPCIAVLSISFFYGLIIGTLFFALRERIKA